MKYYDQRKDQFIKDTLNVNMTPIYTRFVSYLKNNAKVLDIGCGPGRDVKAFMEMGFECIGIEPSEELSKFARSYTNSEIIQIEVEEMDFDNCFDGVWACASLLHVKTEKMLDAFKKVQSALSQNGIAYMSFKYGNFSGIRDDGRYFTDMNEEYLENILTNLKGFELLDSWKTKDLRLGNETVWYNLIFRKTKY